ncbi:MAG: hypothetical protein JW973_11480 [Bacteroidales bacterium]|nr:hypothetical protein [Bacteroidales bacterium]
MRTMKLFIPVVISGTLFFSNLLIAQEEAEKPSKFNAGVDFFSNYIWRGTKFGTGPAIQPDISFSTGGLTIGVWGSFDAFGYTESDPYISYSFPFGLSLGVCDYYYPTHLDTTGSWIGSDFFDLDRASAFHVFEINAGYNYKSLSLSANYIINEAGGAASSGGDMYFQAGYAFKFLNIFVGAGNGWHTSDGKFMVCNIGIGTGKTIKITESFSVEVTGQVILNPEKKQLFGIVGLSL